MNLAPQGCHRQWAAQTSGSGPAPPPRSEVQEWPSSCSTCLGPLSIGWAQLRCYQKSNMNKTWEAHNYCEVKRAPPVWIKFLYVIFSCCHVLLTPVGLHLYESKYNSQPLFQQVCYNLHLNLIQMDECILPYAFTLSAIFPHASSLSFAAALVLLFLMKTDLLSSYGVIKTSNSMGVKYKERVFFTMLSGSMYQGSIDDGFLYWLCTR